LACLAVSDPCFLLSGFRRSPSSFRPSGSQLQAWSELTVCGVGAYM
jgi:hypothetical protein